jgi:cell division protein FtsI (penicillin-binding protein 3)
MADERLDAWRATLRQRVLLGGALLACWTVAIEGRLSYLQVWRHTELLARADRQQKRTVDAPAKRGEIRDRNHRVLAYSVDVDSVYAVPSDIADPKQAAQALCRALDHCDAGDRRELEERLGRKSAFAYVQRFVSARAAERVAALELEGIGFIKENRRFYPNKELAGPLLGYVGVDNKGLGGLEAAYDSVIRGRPGTVLVQTDAKNRVFSRVERSPTTGATLELTIDQYLQHIVERELAAGVAAHRAEGATAVVMDPATGEILAMASYPGFNPNAFRAADPEHRKNRAVTDLYEPGSTFKLVTASAALEEGVVTPNDSIDVSEGLIRFPGRVINDDHRYGVLTFADVIVKSSNVGAIKVGLRLGRDRLGAYVNRFGFGRPTSTEFPGESPGIVWDPSKLNDSALASVSMGYQVGVTPLQMVAATSAIANGGRLLKPRVVRAVVKDGVRAETQPVEVRRVVSPRTAAELTTIMEDVAIRGTGRNFVNVDGFTVAGKTGTAQKLVNGAYSHSEFNVSFTGFVPSRKPVMAIVVVVDTPRAGFYYGGSVAGPIFQQIADASLRHLGVPPTVFPAPPVLVDRRAQAPVERPGAPMVVTVDDAGGRAMPDLTGLSAREALRRMARLGVSLRVQGVGLVVDQYPAPGETVAVGGACTIVLERTPARARAERAAPGAAP